MADILIKDMEMPKSCAFCRFYGVYCYAKGDENAHSTLPCPLIPVPAHGRLIDADAFELYVKERWEQYEIDSSVLRDFREWLRDQPTVIPASKVNK